MNQSDIQHDENQSTNQHGEFVTITINNIKKNVHRGRHSVADLKTLGNIPLAYELLEVIDGVLTPLADDGHVTIKGGESFLGEPHGGRSS
jgi:hypothetical protein